MNELFTQVILAAWNDDTEVTGWMRILVFAILAVFYVLGSILKARANKAKQREEDELTREPGRKPPEGVRGLQREILQWPGRPTGPGGPRRQYRPGVSATGAPRRRAVRPQPVAQKLATKAVPITRLPTIKPPEMPEVSPPRPQLEPKLEELPEFTGKTIRELEDKRIGMPAEIPRIKAVTKPLLDYADPDKLRRAILHYEILGKPLSLRGPGEQIIGL